MNINSVKFVFTPHATVGFFCLEAIILEHLPEMLIFVPTSIPLN